MSHVTPLYIELKRVYRQKEKEFIDLLNRIRVGKQDGSDIQLLNTRFVSTPTNFDAENYITLATTNAVADAENKKKLETLRDESVFFEAQITGDFPINNYPTNRILELKKDTQVMFIKTDTGKGFYNGKIGKVVKFDGDSIIVDTMNEQNEKRSINVEPMIWENILYSWNDDEKTIIETVTGSFKQYPLRLAWAITVHKSQGMTFEKVIADVGNSFAAGQVYVALSRCTSLNGLILKSRITQQAIKTDSHVIEFAKKEVPETLILEKLQKGKADFYYSESRRSLKAFDAEGCYDNFVRAIKYRNDIETSVFKRFVIIWVKRLEKYRNVINELKMSNNNSLITICALENDLSDQIEKNEILINENLKQKEIIDKNNKELYSLNSSLAKKQNVIKSNHEEIQYLNHEIKSLLDDKESLKSYNQTLRTKVMELKKEMDKYKQEKANLTMELERVKKIKWYQKLLGKD